MNIFFLNQDPYKSATLMIDVHVNKMIIESCQMLANAYDEELETAPRSQKGNIRRHSYYNHPCSVWVRDSITNFQWLLDHASALLKERRFRFDQPHFSSSFIDWCKINSPNLKNLGLTKPAQAFKIGVWDHLIDDDPVRGYQRYYVADKHYDKNGKNIFKYTKRNIPEFWDKYYKEFHG